MPLAQTLCSGKASIFDKLMAGADLLLNVAMDVSSVVGVGEGLRVAYVGAHITEHVAEDVGAHALEHAGTDAAAHVLEHEGADVAEHATEDEAAHVADGAAEATVEDAANSGKKTYVIGQNMSRVKAYAKAHGFEYWKAWKKEGQFASKAERDADALRRDVNWVKRLMHDGNNIVDIGADPARMARGEVSTFYNAERDTAAGYRWYYRDADPGL